MRTRKLALAFVTLLSLAAGLTSRAALADMSGDRNFCYVGWVQVDRVAYQQLPDGGFVEVRLGGKAWVCPTDEN